MYVNGKNGIQRTSAASNVVVDTRYKFEGAAAINMIEGLLEASLNKENVSVEYSKVPVSLEVGDVKAAYPVLVCKLTLEKES